MIRYIAVAAAIFAGTLSTQAATLQFTDAGLRDLGQSSLQLDGATIHSGGDSLFVGAGGIRNSICALDSRAFNCQNNLGISFDAPVTDLSFEVGGFGTGDKLHLSVFNAAGQVAGRLGIRRGGVFDLTRFGDVSALFFRDRSANGGVSVGNFSFETAVAPVPLPASLPLLLAGIGAIGFARKKRKSA